jgi:hypothetical protein
MFYQKLSSAEKNEDKHDKFCFLLFHFAFEVIIYSRALNSPVDYRPSQKVPPRITYHM